MKKIKIILGVLVALFVLFVIALLIVGAHLGDIVKAALEVEGPKITKTTLTVDTVGISLLGGSAEVKNLVLGNPEGYKATQSLDLSNATVSLVPRSVMSDKIVIRSIKITALEVTFEGNPIGANNLTKIMDNVESVPGSASPGNNAPAATAGSPAKPSKRYEVDDLVITGAMVHAYLSIPGIAEQEVTLPIPDIHMSGLGTGPEGITGADLTKQVLNQITIETIKTLAVYVTNMGKNLSSAAQNALHDAVNGSGDGINKLRQGLNNLLGK